MRLCAALLMAATLAGAGNGAWPRFEAGVKAYRRGDLRQAEQHFEAVITAEPKFGDAYYYLGVLQQKKGSMRNAVRMFKQVEEKWPTFVLAQERLGQMALSLRKPKVAEKYFLVVAKKAPSVNSWLQLASVQVDIAKYKEAEASLKECTKLTKNNLSVVELQARLYVETDRFQEGYDAYSKILKVMPQDTTVRFMRALCLQELKRGDEAVDEMEKVLKSDPYHRGALLRLIEHYMDKGKEKRVAVLTARLEQLKKRPPRVRSVSGKKKDKENK